MLPFHWQEMLLPAIPVLLLILLRIYLARLRPYRPFAGFRWIQTLLPTLYMVIIGYGQLNYDFRVHNFVLFFTSGILLYHLYGYVATHRFFDFNKYFIQMTKLIFLIFFTLIFSSLLVRILTLIFAR